MTVPEARSNDRLRRYQPRSMRFPVGDRCLRVAVPAGREYLRRGEWARAFGAGDEPPYWVEVWPSSMAVVWALARCARVGAGLVGRRVLDLGCGLGLPGVAAASLGAQVTFSDREADALAFAEWNARKLAAPGATVATALGDWRQLQFDGLFDAVVLADVTYRSEFHDGLLDCLEKALRAGGAVVHADPERVDSALFLRRLRQRLPGAQGFRQVVLGDKRARVRLVIAGAPGGLAEEWSRQLGLVS